MQNSISSHRSRSFSDLPAELIDMITTSLDSQTLKNFYMVSRDVQSAIQDGRLYKTTIWEIKNGESLGAFTSFVQSLRANAMEHLVFINREEQGERRVKMINKLLRSSNSVKSISYYQYAPDFEHPLGTAVLRCLPAFDTTSPADFRAAIKAVQQLRCFRKGRVYKWDKLSRSQDVLVDDSFKSETIGEADIAEGFDVKILTLIARNPGSVFPTALALLFAQAMEKSPRVGKVFRETAFEAKAVGRDATV